MPASPPAPLLALNLHPSICPQMAGFIFSGQRPGPVTLAVLPSNTPCDHPWAPQPFLPSPSPEVPDIQGWLPVAQAQTY